jgi:transposase
MTKDIYNQFIENIKEPTHIYSVDPSQESLLAYTKNPKKTYTQNWPLYYQACRNEKLMFLQILKDAVDYLTIKYDCAGVGRPKAFIPDILKSICIKAYHNYSTWRLESELKLCKSRGIIENVYKRSCIAKYMDDPKIKGLLEELYKIIAEPLAPIETQYAIDATGVSNAYKAKKWVEVRLNNQLHKQYAKLHIVSGTITNVIVGCEITDGNRNDSPILKDIFPEAANRFQIKELSADAGYLSRDNCRIVAANGAVPFIKPKKNSTLKARGSMVWTKMMKFFRNNQLVFAEHYHRRSNVESTFSTLKRKWGDYNRNKKPMAQENEIISRIVCHNAAVLAEGLISYNLNPQFMDN